MATDRALVIRPSEDPEPRVRMCRGQADLVTTRKTTIFFYTIPKVREEEFILVVEMVSVSVGGPRGKLLDIELERDPVVSPSKACQKTPATKGKE